MCIHENHGVHRKYFKLECLSGGQWEEVNCEPVSCPAIPDVFQGMYTCTNGLYYDSRCSLQCPDPAENVRFHSILWLTSENPPHIILLPGRKTSFSFDLIFDLILVIYYLRMMEASGFKKKANDLKEDACIHTASGLKQ